MRELSDFEVEQVSGADLKGMLVGIASGANIGLGMAKWATGGSFGFGAVAQLVGFIFAPIYGAITGGLYGLVTDTASVKSFSQDMIKYFGAGDPGSSILR